ncbi:MAG: class I SAM-dependent methyltransferase, partial [Bacteroidales bacterium]
KSGYNILSIDLSVSQISHATDKAKQSNLSIKFEVQDARHLPFLTKNSMSQLCFVKGGPLKETDEMNYKILQNITKPLPPHCSFLSKKLKKTIFQKIFAYWLHKNLIIKKKFVSNFNL